MPDVIKYLIAYLPVMFYWGKYMAMYPTLTVDGAVGLAFAGIFLSLLSCGAGWFIVDRQL